MNVFLRKLKTFRSILKKDKSQIKVLIYNNLIHTGITNIIPDKLFLKISYYIRFHKKLDLDNPVTFNEKLQWLKLHLTDQKYVMLTDKILVKDYIAKVLGEEYVIPTIGVFKNVKDIDFDSLPKSFVIKCNHDSGSVIVCNNKYEIDWNIAKRKLTRALKTNSYYWGREIPYKTIDRKIIVEKNLNDETDQEIQDYKFMCFSGKVKCSFVCSDRFSEYGLKVTFFDKDWNVLPFERHYPKSDKPIPKPKHYNEMIRMAELLSKDEPFVRVDFYEINNTVYFGELTFFPGCGWEEFSPEEYDKVLGDWIDLSLTGNGK